jgi:hypothetical protein
LYKKVIKSNDFHNYCSMSTHEKTFVQNCFSGNAKLSTKLTYFYGSPLAEVIFKMKTLTEQNPDLKVSEIVLIQIQKIDNIIFLTTFLKVSVRV